MSEPDPVIERLLSALDEVEAATTENIDRNHQLQERAQNLRRRLEAGESIVELVENEDQPRMVELLSSNMAALETAGADFRLAEALALRSRGLTIESIAQLFGVTRQRISALLKGRSA